MVDKSRETKVIWHAVCGVVFLIFTVPVYIYYIYNRKTFNLHPRAGMLSLLSGLYSIVACLAVFCRGFSKSHEDDTLSCNILHTIGFLFPSCFVAPFICRALKVVVQWDDIESMKRFVSVKFSMGMIVVTSVLYWLIGALVLVSPNTEKMLDGKECVVFDYWVYFTSFYSVILLVTFPLLLKLRNIKDKFFISRELKIQFLLLTVFIFTYVLIVIFISCDVITKENASYNLHLNYYLVVLCSASFYVSFLDPFRSGFRRSDDESDTSPSDSKNNMLTALNPLHIDIKMEDLMSMPLEEVIQSDGLYEVLRRVSKRALCLELLHFVLACRMYTHKNNANIVPTVSSFDISPKHTSKVSKPRRTASFAETYFPSMKKYSADGKCDTDTDTDIDTV